MMCRKVDGGQRYGLLYIHSFRLGAPRKQLEAYRFMARYASYGEITSIPDRLRWLRHKRGLMQKEVAAQAGISRRMYLDLENGVSRMVPKQAADRLAAYYRIPVDDLLDDYSRFFYHGQGTSVKAHRERLGMSQQEFANHIGVLPKLVRAWEDESRILSLKSWERYFQ